MEYNTYNVQKFGIDFFFSFIKWAFNTLLDVTILDIPVLYISFALVIFSILITYGLNASRSSLGSASSRFTHRLSNDKPKNNTSSDKGKTK